MYGDAAASPLSGLAAISLLKRRRTQDAPRPRANGDGAVRPHNEGSMAVLRTISLPMVPRGTRRATYRARVRRVRRGRYRAGRALPNRLHGTAAVVEREIPTCWDLQWLDYMSRTETDPASAEHYGRLRCYHQVAHGCVS